MDRGNISEWRKMLHKLKVPTFDDLKKDASNLDDILSQYKKVCSLAIDLIQTDGMSLKEALNNHSYEYLFYNNCTAKIKRFVDYYEKLILYTRGLLYRKIYASEPKSLSDRAIFSLIEENQEMLQLQLSLNKVKEVYELCNGVVDAYTQRGYSLANLTKLLDADIII